MSNHRKKSWSNIAINRIMKEMCCFVTERLITMRRYEFINSILWSDKNNISSAGMIEKLVVTFLNRKIISNDHYWSTKYP